MRGKEYRYYSDSCGGFYSDAIELESCKRNERGYLIHKDPEAVCKKCGGEVVVKTCFRDYRDARGKSGCLFPVYNVRCTKCGYEHDIEMPF